MHSHLCLKLLSIYPWFLKIILLLSIWGLGDCAHSIAQSMHSQCTVAHSIAQSMHSAYDVTWLILSTM